MRGGKCHMLESWLLLKKRKRKSNQADSKWTWTDPTDITGRRSKLSWHSLSHRKHQTHIASTRHTSQAPDTHAHTHTPLCFCLGPPTDDRMSIVASLPCRFPSRALGRHCSQKTSSVRIGWSGWRCVSKSCLLFSTFLWHSASLGLPQVVVDGQSVHADWHSLGRDDGKLLSIRAVLIQLINHLLADALGSGARQLLYLFGVGEVRVECPKLATTVTKQDHEVVGLTLLQLLVG